MSWFHRASTLLALGVVTMSASACGTHVVGVPGAMAARAAAVTAQGVPPATAFQTITCKVTTIMPDDNSGLPHQVFIVTELTPQNGQTLEVDNDTKFGQKVPGLVVGATLTIRGVIYHDTGKSGIHWTHHASRPGDAGFIKTADGHVYQ